MVKIPVKKHVFDPSKSWEENYRALEQHHKEEVEWLVNEVEHLHETINESAWKLNDY